MRYKIHHGDNLEWLRQQADNSLDSVVTDGPYGLGKEPDIVKCLRDWIDHGYHEVKGSGFMQRSWDAFVPQPIFWKEVFRVLKPGGHVVSFSGTRTYDLMVLAMRLAGFEIRDQLSWIYGGGFPKSANVSKMIDKQAGAKREVVGRRKHPTLTDTNKIEEQANASHGDNLWAREWDITAPATHGAQQWDGWGTALSPSHEPIIWATKPLQSRSDLRIFVEVSTLIEYALCLQLNAKFAETIFTSSPKELPTDGQLDFVVWNAAGSIMESKQDESSIMDTFASREAARIFLSIATLWQSISGVISDQTNTFTIEMESSTTTALKTLKSSMVAAIYQNTIHTSHMQTKTPNAPASSVEAYFSGLQKLLNLIQLPTAHDPATMPIWLSVVTDLAHVAGLSSTATTPIESFARQNATIDPTQESGFQKPWYADVVVSTLKLLSIEIQSIADVFAWQKPTSSHEPIVLARKPLEKGLTIAQNVLKWGTGALNIDASRIGTENALGRPQGSDIRGGALIGSKKKSDLVTIGNTQGRWPSNLLLANVPSVLGLFPENAKSGKMGPQHTRHTDGSPNGIYGKFDPNHVLSETIGDSGSASRYFFRADLLPIEEEEELNLPIHVKAYYCSKPSKYERNLGKETDDSHETVKPVALMHHLVTLITPPNGICCDPFLGSGTTGIAAMLAGENIQFRGCEMTDKYIPIATNRIKNWKHYRQFVEAKKAETPSRKSVEASKQPIQGSLF